VEYYRYSTARGTNNINELALVGWRVVQGGLCEHDGLWVVLMEKKLSDEERMKYQAGEEKEDER
jgi:hypothetical protein